MKKVIALSLLLLTSCGGRLFTRVRSGPVAPGTYLAQLQVRSAECGDNIPVGAHDSVLLVVPKGLAPGEEQTGGGWVDDREFHVKVEDDFTLLYRVEEGSDADGIFQVQEGYSLYRVEGLTDVIAGSGTLEVLLEGEQECWISLTVVAENYHGGP